MADPTPVCPKCGEPKTRHTYKSGAQAGKSYWRCGPCNAQRSSEWQKANRERSNDSQRKRYNSARLRGEQSNGYGRERDRAYMAKKVAEYRQRNPDAARAEKLFRRYKLTIEEFDALLASQSGCCAACARTEPGGAGTWHVDHDHSCCPQEKSCGNCVRGLLCNNCNAALGYVNDDIDRLLNLAHYLEAYQQLPKEATPHEEVQL